MHEDTRLRINWYLNLLVVVLAFSIPVNRKWVSLAAVLIIGLWLVEGRWPDKISVLKRHWLNLTVAGFIGFSLLSLAWSGHPTEGLHYIGKYLYLLLIPAIATSMRARFRVWAESAFLVGTAVSLLVSFSVFAGLFRLRDAYPGNPAPTMSHLDYGMVLAVAASIVLVRILEGGSRPKHSALLAALLLFMVGGLLINIGRSGQVAFVVSALVLIPFVLGERSPRAAILGLLVAVLTLAAAYVAVSPFNRRIDAGVDELTMALSEHNYGTNQGMRVAGAIVALDMVREHPFVGTGVGYNMNRFQELLDTRFQHLQPEVAWFPHFHNQYLQTVTETGLIGLLLLLAVFGALVAGPYTEPHDRYLAILLAVTYLVGFVGDPFLHKQLPLVLFAVIAGLASARDRSLFWNTDDQ